MEQADRYVTKPYKNARIAYVMYCALSYLIELLTEDAFLSKLLLRLGVSEARIGVISSLISLAFLSQLLSLPLLRKKISFKNYSVIFTVLGLSLFGVVFLLPLAVDFQPTVQWAALALVLSAHVARKFIAGVNQRWTNDYIDPEKRGSFAALKESVSLVLGIVFSLLIGWVFDHFEKAGRADTAYTLFAIAIFLCALGSFISLLCIPAGDVSEASTGHPAGKVLKNTLGSKPFRAILLLTVLWEMGRYFSIGFVGTFKTETLGMSMLAVQLVNTVSCVFRLLFTPPLGKYTDKHSFVGGIELGLLLALGAFASVVFASRSTWLFIIAHTVLYQVCLAGLYQNFMNISYGYVDARYLTEALVIRASVGGPCGFLSSLAAGALFDPLKAILPASVAPQQVLAAGSCVFLLAALLVARFVVRPLPVKVQ